VEEIHLGDPPGAEKGLGETLTIDAAGIANIEGLVSGESKGPAVNSKAVALETLKIAKEYAGMGVSRSEPPTPTKVKAFLSLYGLPFRYTDTGTFVPYCAAGVGYAAARAHDRLSRGRDLGDDYVQLRDSLPDVTRDYCKTHPSTNAMIQSARARTHANGEAFWASPNERPQQGWLVFFNWSGGQKAQHVGIVDSIVSEGRVLKTVEFNTSRDDPSNGGRVEPKTRSVRYVIGYIRTYPTAGAATKASAAQPSTSAATNGSGARRALLVGISDYETGTNSEDGWRHLNTKRDLENMRYVLETFYGFKSSDIRTLANGEATQSNIVRTFREHLIGKTRPDAAVFYFTGHGHQVLDEDGDEVADGLDEVLVTWVPRASQALPKDQRRKMMYMLDDTIAGLLKDLSASMHDTNQKMQGSIAVIFDSCNSGSATKGDPSLVRKGRPWNEAIDGPLPKGQGGADLASGWLGSGNGIDGLTFLAGSQSNQFSYMMPNSLRDGSAMTYYLTEFLTSIARAKTDRQVTYSDAHRWVSAKVSGMSGRQDPQIEGNDSAPLFGDGTPQVTQWLASVRRALANPLRLELNEGMLHGVTKGSRFAVYKRNSDVSKTSNKLADVEITGVDTTTSTAKIDKARTPQPKPDDYLAAQAVVTEYRFDAPPLRVLMGAEIPGDKATKLLGMISPLQFTMRDGVAATNYDIRLGWDGGLTYQRADGAILALGNNFDANALEDRLLAEWRRKRLVNLTLSATSKVRVDILDKNGLAFPRSEGGKLVLRPGDEGAIYVTNSTGKPMYMSLIILDAAGGITAYPQPSQVKDQQPMQSGTPTRLLSIKNVREPYGIEILKVIATPTPTDFNGMSYKAIDREKLQKGLRNPLEELLFGIADGNAKSLDMAPVEFEGWYTDQLVYEIAPGSGKQ
jgi:hypothetical protein